MSPTRWTGDEPRLLGGEPPKPVDAVAFWRAACGMLAIFSVAGMVGLYGLGLQNGRLDAMQRGADSDYYKALAEGCATAFSDLERVSAHALYATLEASEWLRSAEEYAEAMRVGSADQMAALDQ